MTFEVGTIIGAIITVVASTYCSYMAIKQATVANTKMIDETRRITEHQFQLQIFAEYTRRYQDIFLNMPDEIYAGKTDNETTTKKYMRLYFDLCSEEYHLWKEKSVWGARVVPDDVWHIWLAGMRVTCKHGIYNKSWEKVKNEYNEDFVKYFEDNVISYKEKA